MRPIRLSSVELLEFVKRVLGTQGVPPDDSRIVAECLVHANLSGIDSHGVVRLAHYVRRLESGTVKARPNIRFEKRAASLGTVHGDHGLGHVVMHRACTWARELASESGTGSVVVADSSHFGMTGFYIQQLVSEGYLGMVMTATDAFLIPFGARKAFFGTNPLAVGFPTRGDPLILDMATTSIPYGKVVQAITEGRSIPLDWGFDRQGNPTDDPKRIAGLHPIAGPKGSGLAMVIDVFCSILSEMPWGPHINSMYDDMDDRRRLGHFVMALDIGRFMPLQRFKRILDDMLTEFGGLEPAQGFDRVYYPGQIEGECRRERRQEGIPVDPGLYEELQDLATRFEVPLPR